MVGRTETNGTLPERGMLEQWLEYHRATLTMKCGGLGDDDLRRQSVPPSRLSLLGLVRHITDVERVWFRVVLGGVADAPYYWGNPGYDSDFDDVATADVAADFARWHAECDHSRVVAARLALDDVGTSRGEPVSLRWVYVHMIEEYARHNGHADLLRECVDGATGE
jgi:uncharacterized damage-inducible protein DinB